MKRPLPALIVATATAIAVTWAGGVVPAWSAAHATAAGSWGQATEVPGLAALSKGGSEVTSVSCGAAGSCAAVGRYRDRLGHGDAFVATERKGVWGRAIEIPGLGALSKGDAGVRQVACPSAGNCVAVGSYRDQGRKYQGYVVSERNGSWGRAIEVPGLGNLNKGDAGVFAVSCASAGNCLIGGAYNDSQSHTQGFVDTETNGTWSRAIEVPGLATLNTGNDAAIFTISCVSPGTCAAGGGYSDGSDQRQGFVVGETGGAWGQAAEVPGLATLNMGDDAEVSSVSCATAGNCAVGGDYTDAGENGQGFVATQINGSWGQAIEIPGLGRLNDGFNAEVDQLSCTAAGSCVAIGTYGEPYGAGFVATQKNGVWGKATGAGLTGGRLAGADAVSCASTGNCAAGGFYSDADGGKVQAWVSLERHGRWDNGEEVPGLAGLNKGADAEAGTVSCPPAGRCVAGGYFTIARGHDEGFLVTQK